MSRRVVLGIVGAVVAIILLWWFVIFSPLRTDLSDTTSEIDAAKRRQSELQATVERLKELDRNRPQTEAALRALNAAVPENPDLASFILSANEIAAASGVEFLSVSPSPPQAGTAGGPSSIQLSIQVQGEFFQVLDYLNRLEDLERLVVIDSINLASSSGDTGSTGASATQTTTASSSGPPVLAASLSGRMFTRAAPASTATTGGTGGTATTTTVPGATTTTTPTTTTQAP